MHIKEITVFTNGDSSKIATWSNVPYMLTGALIQRGIRVNRIDLSASPRLARLYQLTILRVIRQIFKRTSHEYYRSYIHFFLTRRIIRSAINRHRESDVYLFLTFSFSCAGLTSKPIVLFGDWTYDHQVRHFSGKSPDFLERSAISRENAQISTADLVVSMFPGITEDLKREFNKPERTYYLGNVINCPIDSPCADVIAEKSTRLELLFVGNCKYLDAARVLLRAFAIFLQKHPAAVLHIVGLNESDLEFDSNQVRCHGYLDKGTVPGRTKYYQLMRNARVFVNTNPKWSAFSASLEAMYFYTPVIVYPAEEFVKSFGSDIPFGAYCHENRADMILACLDRVLDNGHYQQFCQAAHDAVKEFTWSSRVDGLIRRIEELGGHEDGRA